MSFISDIVNTIKNKKTSDKSTASSQNPSPIEVPQIKEGHFESLLTEQNFPGFTIEQNVHVNRFDASAHSACFPITYLFHKDSVPVLAVFIMKTNQPRAMISRGSYSVLENNQIPYIRFYKEFENKKEYVLQRVHDALKEHN